MFLGRDADDNDDDVPTTTTTGSFSTTTSLWSGTNKNRDVSTGPLARPFARSLPRSWDSEFLMSQNDLVLSRSASNAGSSMPSSTGAALVRGTVAPGFESVRDMLDSMLRHGCDTHAQLCVIIGEERVVDLWGVAPDVVDHQFGPDCLVNVFSSTKNMEAIVVAKMVDNGVLR